MKTDKLLKLIQQKKAMRSGGALPLPKAQNGKASNFLQPNDSKLKEGYNIPSRYPSTELATSIGGEGGEPAYLIPSFKYGHILRNPVDEFYNTGDYVGGPFKTWQEADEWDREIRHPYVEKGQPLPSPLKWWGEGYRQGGSLLKHQSKGKVAPYVTSDPKQFAIRQQAYNDSLSLHDEAVKELRGHAADEIGNFIPYSNVKDVPTTGIFQDIYANSFREQNKSKIFGDKKIKPVGFIPVTPKHNRRTDLLPIYHAAYKKPVQPIQLITEIMMPHGGKMKKDDFIKLYGEAAWLKATNQKQKGGLAKAQEGRSYYDPFTDEVHLAQGDATDDAVKEHELYHRYQNMVKDSFRVPEYYPGPLKKPVIPINIETNPQVADYYNRKGVEIEMFGNDFLNQQPSFMFAPRDLIYNRVIDPQMYDPMLLPAYFEGDYPYPYTIEAEAQLYENAVRDGLPKHARLPNEVRYKKGGLAKAQTGLPAPYLNPATVQAVLAKANQPVTNTLGRVVSTPASREKERREKIIAKDPSKYSIEDYKQGIKEPGADNSVLSDPIAMAAALTAGGVGLGATALSQVPRVFASNLASEASAGLVDLLPKNLGDKLRKSIAENLYEAAKRQKQNELKDHLMGLAYSLYDTRPFFEKFPVTKAQKAKVMRKQDLANVEAEQFVRNYYWNPDGTIKEDMINKIVNDLQSGSFLHLGTYPNPRHSIDNVMGSSNRSKLVPMRTKDFEAYVNSDPFLKANPRIVNALLEKRGSAAGLFTDPGNFTFRNFGFYYRNPDDIAETVAHETAHAMQQMGNWESMISGFNPTVTSYPYAQPYTAIGRAFADAMVKPETYDKGVADIFMKYFPDKQQSDFTRTFDSSEYFKHIPGQFSSQAEKDKFLQMNNEIKDYIDKNRKAVYTWNAAPIELHSELVAARMNVARQLKEDGYSDKVIYDALSKPDDRMLDYLYQHGNLSRFFKPTTSKATIRDLLRKLPAIGGIGVAGGLGYPNSSSNEPQYKLGGKTRKVKITKRK
jgi:hypothetical protein